MFIIRKRIFYRARKLKKKVPKNYEQILESMKNLPQLNGNIIKFSLRKDGFATFLSATARKNGEILCNLEWAVRLVLFNDKATINAFTMTIGHELTHQEEEFYNKGLHGKDKIFQSWLNEVHADFGGAEKMVDCDRNKLIDAIEYKLALKKKSKDANSHPSWKRRKFYAEHYDFNANLINRIAEDTKCKNKDLIDEAIQYYDEILLIPQPIITT